MAVGQVYHYHDKKFIIQNPKTLIALASEDQMPEDEEHYQLEVKTSNLFGLSIGNGYYVIPISHPEDRKSVV